MSVADFKKMSTKGKKAYIRTQRETALVLAKSFESLRKSTLLEVCALARERERV
jgi:hypothetical protein